MIEMRKYGKTSVAFWPLTLKDGMRGRVIMTNSSGWNAMEKQPRYTAAPHSNLKAQHRERDESWIL